MRISFETDRLTVAPLSPEHTDFMFALLNSSGWIANIGDRNIQTREDAAAYIEKINDNPNYAYLTFSLKEESTPIGLVTLIKREYLDDCDIGFALLPEHQRKGYSYEASRKYLDLIIASGTYNRIAAITIPQNVASIKLIEKLGLAYESERTEGETQLLVYAMAL